MNVKLLFCAAAAAALASCGPAPIDPKRQIGAHPYLPDIHQYLVPPMHVATNIGWNGATPKAALGLAVGAKGHGLVLGAIGSGLRRSIGCLTLSANAGRATPSACARACASSPSPSARR